MKKSILIFTIIFAVVFSLQAEKVETNFDENTIIPQNNKYNWNSIKKWNNFRSNFHHKLGVYKIYQEEKQSAVLNGLKSLVAPGWGHFSAKSYTKGEILLGLEIFLAGSAIYFYDKSQDFYDKYQDSNYIKEMSQYYTDANNAYQNSQILVSLSILVWTYTIFDSFTATEDYNRNLWNDLMIEYKDKQIKLTPQGINIRF